MTESQKDFMLQAIELAKEGMLAGNGGPFGCVIVKDGEIIGRGSNMVLTTKDPTAHAEVVAIREACKNLNNFQLDGCEVFTSCEPCPMCSSMAVWANVSAVVFGASIDATAARGKARITIPAAEVIARSPALVEVYPGVLGAECTELY